MSAGASCVEFDVQLTADEVPVLFHDETVRRTTGAEGRIVDLTWNRVRTLDAGEAARFDGRFRGTLIPTLAEVARRLAGSPAVTIFVDVKPHCFERFGRTRTMACILAALGPARAQTVITCCDADALVEARRLGAGTIAWVVPDLSEPAGSTAARLVPAYLFCDVAHIPDVVTPFWPGSWRWVVYGIEDPRAAWAAAARGADMIETQSFVELRAQLRRADSADHVA